MLTTRINKWNKSPVVALTHWRRHDPRNLPPADKQLTQEQLTNLLVDSAFNLGDYVFYGNVETQCHDLSRIGYIFDIEWDVDQLHYTYSHVPKPFAILPLNYTTKYYRDPHFNTLVRSPICRWDSCEGYSVLNPDLHAELIDDYVQNYVKDNSKHSLIR